MTQAFRQRGKTKEAQESFMVELPAIDRSVVRPKPLILGDAQNPLFTYAACGASEILEEKILVNRGVEIALARIIHQAA